MHPISTLASNFQVTRTTRVQSLMPLKSQPKLASFRKIALASNFQPPQSPRILSHLNGKNSPRQHPKPLNYFRSRILFFIGGRNCLTFAASTANFYPRPHPKTAPLASKRKTPPTQFWFRKKRLFFASCPATAGFAHSQTRPTHLATSTKSTPHETISLPLILFLGTPCRLCRDTTSENSRPKGVCS